MKSYWAEADKAQWTAQNILSIASLVMKASGTMEIVLLQQRLQYRLKETRHDVIQPKSDAQTPTKFSYLSLHLMAHNGPISASYLLSYDRRCSPSSFSHACS